MLNTYQVIFLVEFAIHVFDDDHFVLFLLGYIQFWLVRSCMLTEFLSHQQGFFLSKLCCCMVSA